MASQMGNIARAIGVDAVRHHNLLRELLELLNDEEASVKRAAFTTFVSLLDFFDVDTRMDTMIPIIKNYCKSPPDELVLPIGQSFGEFFTRIAGV